MPYEATRDDWETPPELFAFVNDEVGFFTLDAAANADNAKCARFASGPCVAPELCRCGLCCWWGKERVWCNPPYGRGLIDWVRKFAKGEADFAVMLLPANTDTAWFAELWQASHEIWFLTGRVNFVGSRGGNTGGSVLAMRSNHLQRRRADPRVELVTWRTPPLPLVVAPPAEQGAML